MGWKELGYILERKFKEFGDGLDVFMQCFKISSETFANIALVSQKHGVQNQMKYKKCTLTSCYICTKNCTTNLKRTTRFCARNLDMRKNKVPSLEELTHSLVGTINIKTNKL